MRALEPLPRLIRIPAITSLRIVSALYWSILHTSAGLYCSGSMLIEPPSQSQGTPRALADIPSPI
jgi:hypothetical protein